MWGSGFIPILLYASVEGSIADNAKNILTENSFEILTEAGQDIDTET